MAEFSFKNALRLNPEGTIKAEILYHLGLIMKRNGNYKVAAKVADLCC